MKTLSRIALILPLLVLALPSQAQTPTTIPISGNLGSIAGTPSPDAYITLLLENCAGGYPQITGYHGIVQTSYQFVADTNGNINGNIWGNDLITCSGTTGATIYALSLYDPNGSQIGTTQCYQVLSTQGTWNVNSQTPVACGTTPPNPTNGTFGNLTSTGFFQGNNGNFSSSLSIGTTTITSGPGGLSASAAFSASSINGTVNALQFAGSDLGAKITAADANLGSNCGVIEVPPGNSNLTVTTSPTISSCHTLYLRSPITWALNIGPTLHSNATILGDGPAAVQTINTNAGWTTASNLSNLVIENLWATNTYATPPVDGTALMQCYSCNGIRVSQNHVLGAGVIYTSCTSGNYAGVSSANVTQNVIIDNNFVDGQLKTVDLAEIVYTQHVAMTNNIAINAQYNVEWWGGNAQTDGATLSNPRWAQDISITGGAAYNVRAGFWGGMGQNVTVSGVTVDGCSDVCLDDESGINVNFSGFTVRNSVNGGIATFWYSRNVSFGPGTVMSDLATDLPARIYNATTTATNQTNIKIHNVKFQCNDAANLCPIYADPVGGFEFTDNTLLNTVFSFVAGVNNSGFKIDRNTWQFTYVPVGTFNVINVPGIGGNPGTNYSFLDSISNNVFRSDLTPQSSGTYAINVNNNDSSFVDTVQVKNNSTTGFTNDALLKANSSNAGLSPTFITSGNIWGGTGATESTLGAQGTFENLDAPTVYGLFGNSNATNWIKLGTWVPQGAPHDLAITIYAGNTYTSGLGGSAIAFLHVRTGNGSAAPNLNDAQIYTVGSAAYDQIKVAATGGSTSTSNMSWDVYVHQAYPFDGGQYTILIPPTDMWTSTAGGTSTDPGSASTSVFVGTVAQMAINGQAATFSSLTDTGAAASSGTNCLQIDTSGHITNTGSGCGAGGAGVASINTVTGAFTFTGAGVSCSSTTCTFPGGGGTNFNGIVSGTNTTAAMLVGTGASLGTTGSGTIQATSLTGNIPESQVTNLTTDLAGKVPTSTTVNGHALSANVTVSASDITTGTLPHAQLPALVSGDIPNNTANTTGTAGGLTGSPAITVTSCTGCEASQYKIRPCSAGLGDGLNAIPAGTYTVNFLCENVWGVTYTITGIKGYSDNNGTSTCNVSDSASNALLTGAITTTNTGASGTQSAHTTLGTGVWTTWTIVADGTSKQIQCRMTGTI